MFQYGYPAGYGVAALCLVQIFYICELGDQVDVIIVCLDFITFTNQNSEGLDAFDKWISAQCEASFWSICHNQPNIFFIGMFVIFLILSSCVSTAAFLPIFRWWTRFIRSLCFWKGLPVESKCEQWNCNPSSSSKIYWKSTEF